MVTPRDAIASTLPAGLLEELRADAKQPVRPAEVARVRRSMHSICLDHPDVIDGIAEGLLESPRVATS